MTRERGKRGDLYVSTVPRPDINPNYTYDVVVRGNGTVILDPQISTHLSTRITVEGGRAGIEKGKRLVLLHHIRGEAKGNAGTMGMGEVVRIARTPSERLKALVKKSRRQ